MLKVNMTVRVLYRYQPFDYCLSKVLFFIGSHDQVGGAVVDLATGQLNNFNLEVVEV